MYTTKIQKGTDLHILSTEKFNTVTICLLLRTPLDRATVTANSLLAKSILNGCSKYKTKRAIEIRLEEINASISSGILKKGEEHIIELYCKCTPTYTEETIELLGDILFKPLFNFMDTSKADLENTINSLINDKRSYALEKCIETMCEKEPYGINGDGYVEDINNVAIHSHYTNVLENAKAEIIVIGNVNEAEITEYIKKYIPLSPRNTHLEPCNYLYYPASERHISENMDITQGKLCVGLRMNINPLSEDWYRAIVANELFGGSASSALFMEARESESLCYYISSKLLRFKSIMIIEAGIDSKNKDKVIEIIKSAFENISEDNIEIAKQNIINGYKTAQDKPERIMDALLGGLIAGKVLSFDEITEKIANVSDIKNVFHDSYLDTVYMLGGKQ